MKRSRMLLGNILIIAVIMILTFTYVSNEQKRNLASKIDAFENMTVAMENVTANYLEGEQQVCLGRANYINSNDLTAEQAIDFVSDAISSPEIMAHILYTDTGELSGLSTSARGDDKREQLRQRYPHIYESNKRHPVHCLLQPDSSQGSPDGRDKECRTPASGSRIDI